MIRPATPADAAAIAAIWAPIIRDTAYTFTDVVKSAADIVELITARAAAGHPFFVAEQAETVLGFATYAQFRSGPGYAHCMEHSVILAAHARRQGVGRALMTALTQHATAAGHAMLIGGISGANPVAIEFHTALGFIEVGRVLHAGWKFGQYHDLILMQKKLPPPDGQTAARDLD